MIDKIIVTTDFSECGNSALKFACGLWKQMGAKVAVLTIIEREKHESAYFIDYKPLESKENADKAAKLLNDVIPTALEQNAQELIKNRDSAAMMVVRRAANTAKEALR
mgnify:CR=1 FL=1